jgi:site-specific DNA-methyltransferase (adenine-specific)
MADDFAARCLRAMGAEAAKAGFYTSPWGNHPRLQLLTVAELLDGKGIDYPRAVNVTFKTAPKAKRGSPENLALSWDEQER